VRKRAASNYFAKKTHHQTLPRSAGAAPGMESSDADPLDSTTRLILKTFRRRSFMRTASPQSCLPRTGTSMTSNEAWR
jgi:hypothetical protein